MQQRMTLVIGSKARSSWSLRPWLFLRHHEVPFEEIVVPLGQKDSRARILDHSPSGKLPCLLHGSLKVWESLAICEYAAETLALPLAWPLDPAARALARAMTSEMHAGFAELRREMPFDALRKPAAQAFGEKAGEEIRRVRALWREARSQHGRGGPWLFGKFGIVDAMFAPVALRFHAYELPLDGVEREYMFNVLMHPAVQAWLDAAAVEQVIDDPAVGETHAERTAEIPAEVANPPSAPQPPAAPRPEAAAAKPQRYVDDPSVTQESHPEETQRDLPRREPAAAAAEAPESMESLLTPRDPANKPAPGVNPVIAENKPAEPTAAEPVKLRSFILPP